MSNYEKEFLKIQYIFDYYGIIILSGSFQGLKKIFKLLICY